MADELPPLPDAKDEFWKDAHVETHTLEKPVSHDHTFTHKSATEVLCHCGIGFILSAGMILKDNHIYYKNTLVV